MRERPILFNGAMLRSILAGQKTQTRRVCKPQPSPGAHTTGFDGKPMSSWWETGKAINYCPFGQPGDRLWVRETWRGVVNIAPPGSYEYAVARYVPDREHCRRVEYAATQTPDSEPWRPSIHMPRWACRLELEIVSVRVERLQAISEADAIAEGLSKTDSGAWLPGPCDHPEWAFHQLWAQVYGEPSWDSNPWVWVIEFKRVEVANG